MFLLLFWSGAAHGGERHKSLPTSVETSGAGPHGTPGRSLPTIVDTSWAKARTRRHNDKTRGATHTSPVGVLQLQNIFNKCVLDSGVCEKNAHPEQDLPMSRRPLAPRKSMLRLRGWRAARVRWAFFSPAENPPRGTTPNIEIWGRGWWCVGRQFHFGRFFRRHRLRCPMISLLGNCPFQVD